MVEAEDLVEWLVGCAAFIVGAGLAFLISLRLSQVSNKVRYWLLLLLYILHATAYGAFALGDGDYLRADSRTVVIGRYILYFSHAFFGAFLALSIVPNYFAALVAAGFAFLQQLFLWAGARATGDLNWFYLIPAGVFWLLQAALFVVFLTPNRSADALPTQKSALGITAVWIVKIFAVAAFAVYIMLYVVDQAWQSWVSRFISILLHALLDVAIKIGGGLILLLFFKPEEDQVDNINLSFGIEDGGGSVLSTQHCGAQVNAPAQGFGYATRQQQQQQQSSLFGATAAAATPSYVVIGSKNAVV